jgi:acetyl esterase/lipase
MTRRTVQRLGPLALALLASVPVSGQVSRLPAAIQAELVAIGPRYQSDIRTHIPRTRELFLPLLAESPKAGVRVTADLAFGDDPAQRLDVYRPEGAADAPVVVFVHGGALTRGDKNANAEVYANVMYFFARHGVVGINTNYRLAPEHRYPSAALDIGSAVAWARANVADHGGDPDRIFLVGHSSGGTHAATWAYDPAIHGAAGPGVAGLVLLSGRLTADNRPGDPNAAGVEAYFGTDPSLYPSRSPVSHGAASDVPTFIVVAEFDNPFLDAYGADLFSRICSSRGRCPRFTQLIGHNHMSMVMSFNTADEALGLEILEFIEIGW